MPLSSTPTRRTSSTSSNAATASNDLRRADRSLPIPWVQARPPRPLEGRRRRERAVRRGGRHGSHPGPAGWISLPAPLGKGRRLHDVFVLPFEAPRRGIEPVFGTQEARQGGPGCRRRVRRGLGGFSGHEWGRSPHPDSRTANLTGEKVVPSAMARLVAVVQSMLNRSSPPDRCRRP